MQSLSSQEMAARRASKWGDADERPPRWRPLLYVVGTLASLALIAFAVWLVTTDDGISERREAGDELPLDWRSITLPTGVEEVAAVVVAGSELMIDTPDGLWATADLASWRRVALPVGARLSPWPGRLSSDGVRLALLTRLPAGRFHTVAGRLATDDTIDVDGRSVTVRVRDTSIGLHVTDRDGTDLVDVSINLSSTTLPDQVSIDGAGGLGIVTDDGLPIARLHAADLGFADDSDDPCAPAVMWDADHVLYVSDDAGLTWRTIEVDGPIRPGPRTRVDRTVEAGFAAGAILVRDTATSHTVLECILAQAGLGDLGGGPQGRAIEAQGVRDLASGRLHTWAELGADQQELLTLSRSSAQNSVATVSAVDGAALVTVLDKVGVDVTQPAAADYSRRLAAGDALSRAEDGARTWVQALLPEGTVTRVDAGTGDLRVATIESSLHRSDDRGRTWRDLGDPGNVELRAFESVGTWTVATGDDAGGSGPPVLAVHRDDEWLIQEVTEIAGPDQEVLRLVGFGDGVVGVTTYRRGSIACTVCASQLIFGVPTAAAEPAS